MPALETSNDLSLFIQKETVIAAPAKIVFDSILAQLGPEFVQGDGKAQPLKIEAWVGGRWFRDLGNNTGHLWGHVQVIKPPKLLELVGPMWMSFPVASHLQYRLTEQAGGILLKLTHKAMGLFPPELVEQ